MRWVVAVAGLACACGRIDFGARDGGAGGDAPDGDAPTDLGPSHVYRLHGTYADDLGGPPLEPLGGGFGSTPGGGYVFAANQGLRVSGALPARVYTVELTFAFDTLNSWRKLLDYQGLATDEGLYTYDLSYQFVVVAGVTFATSPSLLSPGVVATVTLTRDAGGAVVGYVSGTQQYNFQDDAAVAALPSDGAPASFFVDDTATGGGEADGGSAHEIRIWDRALTPAEVAQVTP